MSESFSGEKKAGSLRGSDLNQDMQKFLVQINREIKESQFEMNKLYALVSDLHQQNAPPESYRQLLAKINELRDNIEMLENSWREMAVQGSHEEAYSLWHQPETTIGQLVVDYGSHNFVYMVPPEISAIKISIDSNLPIPRSSWGEMLEMILTQNGVGFRQLNPFLRQLFFLKENRSALQLITNKPFELELLPPDARVAFMLTPEPAEVRRIWMFLDKFVNPNSTSLQLVGRDILIIGQVGEVQDMLKLYEFISANKGDKEYKVFPMHHVDAEEMAKILAAIFTQFEETPTTLIEPKETRPREGGGPSGPGGTPRPPIPRTTPTSGRPQENLEINGLRIIALSHVAQALFLVGTKEDRKSVV